MTQSAPFTYQAPDFLLSVTSEPSGIQTVTRLFRGSNLLAEHRGVDSQVTLHVDDRTVVVKLGPFGGISQALLLPPGANPEDAERVGAEFSAPPGTFTARVQAWGNRHPDLYAARHVAIAIGQTVLGIIGFGAVLLGLLPSIPWPAVALPEFPHLLPHVALPSLPLPRIALPAIPHLPITRPAWLDPLFSALKYLSPIVIALIIAVREARHRRQRREHAAPGAPTMPRGDRATQIQA